MSIMQGGGGLPFLAEPVYNYLCTGVSTGIEVHNKDIPDHTLRFVLDKVGTNIGIYGWQKQCL